MHLLIDLQGLQNESRFRGIGRYSSALLRYLMLCKDPSDRVTLLLNGALDTTLPESTASLLEAVDIRVWFPVTPCDWSRRGNLARRRASELIREKVLDQVAPDVVLISSLVEGCGDDVITSVHCFSRIPVACVFYDLIPLIFKDSYLANPILEEWYREKIGYLECADRLLAISATSMQEVTQTLGVDSTRVSCISSGIDTRFFASLTAESASLPRGLSPKRFFLYVGAADPRKNLVGLIRGYAGLSASLRSVYPLVIAGKLSRGQEEALRQEANVLGVAKRGLLFTGHVPDTVVASLYKNCLAFVFPSLHEGFGLPMLEAIALGAPVIASNRSTSLEVLGSGEALFDPEDTSQLTTLLARLIEEPGFSEALRSTQQPRLGLFRWEDVAQRTWGALRQTVEVPKSLGEVSRRSEHDNFGRTLAREMERCRASFEDYLDVAEKLIANGLGELLVAGQG